MTEKINVGVIGCGNWGSNHIRVFSSIRDVEIMMICDINENILLEGKLVTDSTAQCAKSGELQHAIQSGKMTLDEVHGELGEIISKEKISREHTNDITIFYHPIHVSSRVLLFDSYHFAIFLIVLFEYGSIYIQG